MKRLKEWGSYMWTASAAGWLVIGRVVDSQDAQMVGVLCLFMAVIWMLTIDTD